MPALRGRGPRSRTATRVAKPVPNTNVWGADRGARRCPGIDGPDHGRSCRWGVVTVVPAGGVKTNIEGSIAPKDTEVKPASMDGAVRPFATTATSNGSRVCASIDTSIDPTSVREARGTSTSRYTGRPATRAVPSTSVRA